MDLEKGRISSCYKHPSFKSEKEVRYIILCTERPYLRVDYKLIGGLIRKVLVLDLGKLCVNENVHFETLFDGIILGPRSKQNEYDLRCFIESLGLKDLAKKITKSKCLPR